MGIGFADFPRLKVSSQYMAEMGIALGFDDEGVPAEGIVQRPRLLPTLVLGRARAALTYLCSFSSTFSLIGALPRLRSCRVTLLLAGS